MNQAKVVMSLVIAVIAGAAGASEPFFCYMKDLEVQTLDQEELVAAELDSDVFAATQNGLADVRIIDGNQRNVSFLIRKATDTRSETVRNYWDAPAPDARPLDSGGLQIEVQLRDDAPQPDGIELSTPLKDFEQRLTIYGSIDGTDWALLAEDALIFDYSRFVDVRTTGVAVPENNYRRFRIVVDNITAEQESQWMELTRRLRDDGQLENSQEIVVNRRPFRVDQIRFWHDILRHEVTKEKQTEYPIQGFNVESLAEENQTAVFVNSFRQPLTRLTLSTSQRNFSREVSLDVLASGFPGGDHEWRTIQRARISHLDFQDFQSQNLSLTFDESRQEQYRILIHNEDSAPLEISDVAAEGPVYRAIFLAAPGNSYRLIYGSTAATSPNYDTAALSEILSQGYEPQSVGLGPQVENPAAGAPAVALSEMLLDTRVLLGVVVVLVIVLGFLLYRASQRLETE